MNRNLSTSPIDTEQIDVIIADKYRELIVSLDKSLAQVMFTYEQLQAANKKGPLSYIYISWLRSSAMLDLPLIRIDLYDQRGYMDLEECYVSWDIDCVTSEISQPCNSINQKDRPTPRTEYENEKAWMNIVEKICKTLEKHIVHVLENITIEKSICDTKIYYGEFLDKTVQIR